MKALLIGAGQIGSRHLQSLAKLPSLQTVYVVEPNPNAEEIARARWQEVAQKESASLQFLPVHALNRQLDVDVAIIATPAVGRLAVLRTVIEMGITKVVAEKILFQSIAEFRLAMELCEQNSIEVVCNHVYRYVEIFSRIRKILGHEPFTMDVQAGNNGMGCNLIHLIDLFQYLSKSEIQSMETTIERPLCQSKRGKAFVEFSGKAEVWSSHGSRLCVVFSGVHPKPPVFTITSGHSMVLLDEGTSQVHTNIAELEGIPFMSPRISDLTQNIVKELLTGSCRLPTLRQSFQANYYMLQAFNEALFGKRDEAQTCPIT